MCTYTKLYHEDISSPEWKQFHLQRKLWSMVQFWKRPLQVEWELNVKSPDNNTACLKINTSKWRYKEEYVHLRKGEIDTANGTSAFFIQTQTKNKTKQKKKQFGSFTFNTVLSQAHFTLEQKYSSNQTFANLPVQARPTTFTTNDQSGLSVLQSTGLTSLPVVVVHRFTIKVIQLPHTHHSAHRCLQKLQLRMWSDKKM